MWETFSTKFHNIAQHKYHASYTSINFGKSQKIVVFYEKTCHVFKILASYLVWNMFYTKIIFRCA